MGCRGSYKGPTHGLLRDRLQQRLRWSSEMATIFFDLVGIPPSANKRLHFRVRAKANKDWKGWAALAARDAANRSGAKDLPWERAHVRYTFFYPRETHADLDNLIGSGKPVLDATKGILVVDDSATHVHEISAHIEKRPKQAAGLRVEVTRCECRDAQDGSEDLTTN